MDFWSILPYEMKKKKKAWMILILILQSLQTKNVLFVEIQALV